MHTTELVGMSVVHANGKDIAGEVVDVAVQPGKATIPFVLVETNPAGGSAPVLVAGDALRCVDGKLYSVLPKAQFVAEADGDEPSLGHLVDETAMPPIIVGPLGNTIAPALMAALFNARRQNAPRPDLPDAEAAWVSEIADQPVFDASGELGRLVDFEIDPDSMVCQEFIIRRPDGARIKLPFSAIRNVPDKASHVVVSGEKGPFAAT